MLTNLLRLEGNPVVHQAPQPMPSMSPNDTVANIEFRGKTWYKPRKAIKDVTFSNVGISKTTLNQLTFTNCSFIDCLFIGTIFKEIEFHNCTFKDCTFLKAHFERCYLDPNSISLSRRYRVEASNLGVTLYQALLSNYSSERQDEFFAKADFKFRQWKRYQIFRDLREERISLPKAAYRWVSSATYQLLAGFGYKPLRFFMITIALIFAISLLNYAVIGDHVTIEGVASGHVSFVDTIFYTFSIITVLGFSNIVPADDLGKLLAVGEALAAVGWLGIFTSLLVKRFLR